MHRTGSESRNHVLKINYVSLQVNVTKDHYHISLLKETAGYIQFILGNHDHLLDIVLEL